jgi:hypothetical protein
MSNSEKKLQIVWKKAGDAADKLLRFLRIRPAAGGLEVTDQLLRLAYSDGTTWQFRAVRMEPGVCEEGKIKDPDAFYTALMALRAQVPELAPKDRTMNVVVSLGAASVYNQIFNLPLMKKENFETAVKLNLQMSSPMDVAETYSGWETINRDEALGRAEVLGAFANRAMVDTMTNAIFPAGFVAIAVESKALAIARVVRECGTGFDAQKSYLVAIIDDSGLDFIILRRGWLCFEYMNPWRDIADEKGAITISKFTQAFALGLRQVANFYRQHWQDPIAGIGLSGDFLMQEARAVIGKTESMPIFLLEDALGGLVSDAWITSLGSGLRATAPRNKDREITFFGEGARELFENNRVIDFLSFWRVATPAVLGILLGVFVFANIFLTTAENSTAANAASIVSAGVNTRGEMTSLLGRATDFNNNVAMISSVQSSAPLRSAIMEAIMTAAAENGITLTRVTLSSDHEPISVSGQSQSEDSILAFKSAIGQISGFGPVNLPLAGVQGSGTSYTFSMTFSETGGPIAAPSGAGQ